MPGSLLTAKGTEGGLCGSHVAVGDSYASDIVLPLSTFILASLHESPQGMLIFFQTANTPGGHSELGNLDSTPDSPPEEPRGHENASSPPPALASSSVQ